VLASLAFIVFACSITSGVRRSNRRSYKSVTLCNQRAQETYGKEPEPPANQMSVFGKSVGQHYSPWHALLSLTAAFAVGCNADSVVNVDTSELNRTIEVSVGSQVAVTLQTIGPGEFAAPELSSPSLRFLNVEYVNPVPAGPTQRFTFFADARGTSVVVFRHTASNRIVQDTVVVK